MYETLSKAIRIGGTAILLTSVVLVGILAVPGVIGAKSSFVVLSQSMQPELQPGDMVVVDDAAPNQIDEGDVITFATTDSIGSEGQDRITHRVVEKRQTDSGVRYLTKGDANDEPDPSPVAHSQVIGEVWFHIPMVGRIFLLLRDSLVQILLAVVPGALLVVSGLRSLYEEATVVREE